ncbi:VCBS repeat-containing protein [Maribacter sp. MMG018]|uniref:FG-GAP-like repeat-containing protein n=1 Tax=Maribacter sp. MMG018 TaxID=2822688 RepID=UPI001B386AAF|nr:FG-GAP-like repeat-containing protein [Maribacter sp. MMG018]MBQ4916316.1 VCBS repeat-containing protein [Maribacter sp. MMG018]
MMKFSEIKNYFSVKQSLLVMIMFGTVLSSAQTTFTESAASFGLNLGKKKDGGHAWADFDGDGLLDVLVLENNSGNGVKSFLMRQSPAGTFTNVQSTLAPGMLGDGAERQAVWGDLNNDGRPDFMINSHGSYGSGVAIQIFIQNANGTFGNGVGGTSPITIGRSGATINISSLNTEGAGFFDFEGDGDLDIFFDSHNFGIELLRNNFIDHTTHSIVNPGPGSLFTHITPGSGSGVTEYGLNQYATDGDYGTAADVNDDGWVDIFMRKRDENDFFLNQGGMFANGADLGQAYNSNKGGNGLWDLDNDGDLDAVWTENGLTQIFRNDGAGVWTALGSSVFPGLPQPSNTNNGSSSARIDALAGGDIDNDGDIDLLLVGNSRSYLYINQLNSPTPAPGVVGSGSPMTFSLDPETFNSGRDGEGTTMVDVDDDGDLDIYMNINNHFNQLYINNLPAANRKNHLIVNVTEDRSADGSTGAFPGRVAIGTNVIIKDCAGNIVSGLRQVNGVYGHGTQQPEQVHFGLPLGEDETYIIEVRYPNFVHPTNGVTRLVATTVAQPSTISGTNHYSMTTTDAETIENPNPPVANDDLEVVSYGNTVSVQIDLFANDSEPDGENFFIESVVQPAIGNVSIDDADNGLVTYTYSGATPFPGTTFEYTITDATSTICPAQGKSDTATVTVYEPCADPTGIDTDGDGINDVCDLDNDNDGILDTDECIDSSALVENGDFTDWIFYNSWTGSGQSWNKNANRAYYAQWNGAGTATFYQTINVSPNILNTITFDVGAYADYSGESTLEVKIDGVVYYTETSTQIAVANGGNAQNGNETLYMVSRSFSFTPTSNTVTLSFDGSSPVNNHDLLYVDNVMLSTGCGDLDGDGITAVYDLDSDGDGCFDALEGAGSLAFSDLNGDGTIAGTVDNNGVPIAASGGQGKGSSADYTVTSGLCDDDGDGVNNANDKCPYFDDAIDSDNDGIPDGCDVDDDNDGISDCDESTESVSNEFAWTLNTPSGNLEMDTDYTPEINDWILDETKTMVLNSPIFSISGSNLRISSMSAQNKEEAIANGDYVEVSFTTGSELSSILLNQIRSGWYQPNQGDSYYTATAFTKVGSNVWTTLSEDVLHTDDGSGYATFQHLATGPLYLDADTEYAFRFYAYGQMDDSSESYSILDDIAFGFIACRSGDLDGDTTPNHLDDDSDGDGCNDADEAYGVSGTDSDGNGMYGSGSPTVNSDGSVAAASYDVPEDGDSDGNYDFLQAGVAPIITLQPQNSTICSSCSTTMEVSASNTDIYQWQLFNGSTWEDLTDTGIHSGTTTNVLTITNPSGAANGNQYRVVVANSIFVCSAPISSTATLTIESATVITNRRITYRIRKD